MKRLPLINAIVADFPSGATLQVDATGSPEVARIDEDIPLKLIGGEGGNRPARPSLRRYRWLPKGLNLCSLWRRRRSANLPQCVPWGVAYVGAPDVWEQARGDRVAVAVLDTGIDLRHPDLRSNVAGGYNVLSPGKAPLDDNGHGSHVAGTIGAVDDEFGVVGVVPEARLYAVKALNKWGFGYLSDLIEGLGWCVNEGIRVVNLSLGTREDNRSFHDAIHAAHAAGVVVVAAAGNDGPGENNVNYPARYAETIAVSAINKGEKIPRFASQGPEVDLVAPGVGVHSTWKMGQYRTLNGTSMAAPHAAGAAALLLSLHPDWTPDQVKEHLIRAGRRVAGVPYPALDVAAALREGA